MRGGVRGPSRSPAAAPGGAAVLRECDVCGTRCVAKRCGRCGRRSYCGVRCQREDWASHRVACGVAPAAGPFEDRHLSKTGIARAGTASGQ